MTKRSPKTGKELEQRVANAYREMGARKVEHDVELAGNQIDVYVELEAPGRLLHSIAVEVKDWSKPVGIDIVNGFAHIVGLLRQKQLIDEGIIVSARGFSKPARNAAKSHRIRLLELADLDAMVAGVKDTERQATSNLKPLESTLVVADQEASDVKTKPIPPPHFMPQTVEKSPRQGKRSMFNIITWLHLSDFHFQAFQTYDSNVVLRSLLDDLKERIRDDGLQPDFVIVSGDIAFASRPKEYKLARQFLDDLIEATGLCKERLFLVPGNHDVSRNAISELATHAASVLNDRDSVNRALSSASDRRLLMKRFRYYKSFVNGYLGKEHIPFDDTRYFYVKHIELAGIQVAILGLNSAWLSASDKDRNNLVLGERQVRTALELEIAKDADLRLAVMHHPFNWLQDSDKNAVEPLLCEDCDFVLHGHMHQVGLLQTRSPDEEAMIIAAGACYETREHPNSYNIVRLDFSKRKGAIYLRMYSDKRGGFWAKDVVNYRNVKDGIYTFPLSKHLRSRLQSLEKLNPILRHLNNGQSVAIVGETRTEEGALLPKLANLARRRDSPDTQRLLISYIDLLDVGGDYTATAFWKKAFEPMMDLSDSAAKWVDYAVRIHRVDEIWRELSDHLEKRGQKLVLLLNGIERLLSHPEFQSFAFFSTLLHSFASWPSLLLVVATSWELTTLNVEGRRLPGGGGSPLSDYLVEVRP